METGPGDSGTGCSGSPTRLLGSRGISNGPSGGPTYSDPECGRRTYSEASCSTTGQRSGISSLATPRRGSWGSWAQEGWLLSTTPTRGRFPLAGRPRRSRTLTSARAMRTSTACRRRPCSSGRPRIRATRACTRSGSSTRFASSSSASGMTAPSSSRYGSIPRAGR
jgi:hypothetical protein